MQEYMLYVPHSAGEHARVLVSVHGISRNYLEQTGEFTPLCERYGVVMLAPIFTHEMHGDYQRLKEALHPVAEVAPVHIGLGNHDDRANFFKVFEEPPGQTARLNGKHITIIEHPEVRVLVLDSLLYVNKVAGLLGKNQRLWLQRYVQGADTRPIVLFVHHTLGDGDGDLLDVDRLFSILSASSKVKAIFYGHSHQWNHSEREGVQLINLPAVGYNFNDAEPVGWVDAEFLAGGVKLQLHAFAGNTAKHGETLDIDWAD
jgi:3',5'-cyclic AMP phosphodiesterase CpdA